MKHIRRRGLMMISMRLETPSRGAHHCASCASKQQHDHREKKRHWNYHHRCTFWETNKKERSSFFSLIYSSALYTHSFSVVINWSRTREKSVLAEQKLGLDTLNIKLEIFPLFCEENVKLLRGLSGVVYGAASSRCRLKRKKVFCGFVFIIVVLYITS